MVQGLISDERLIPQKQLLQGGLEISHLSQFRSFFSQIQSYFIKFSSQVSINVTIVQNYTLLSIEVLPTQLQPSNLAYYTNGFIYRKVNYTTSTTSSTSLVQLEQPTSTKVTRSLLSRLPKRWPKRQCMHHYFEPCNHFTEFGQKSIIIAPYLKFWFKKINQHRSNWIGWLVN